MLVSLTMELMSPQMTSMAEVMTTAVEVEIDEDAVAPVGQLVA